MLSRIARKCLKLIEQMEFHKEMYFKPNIGFIKTCITMELESNTHRRKSINKARKKK